MTTTLTPPETSTKVLSFDKASREYVGEISDTNGFGPVDEGRHVGMTLVGKTGRKVVFVVAETAVDFDGDVEFWLLRPLSVIGTPIASVTVLLFND